MREKKTGRKTKDPEQEEKAEVKGERDQTN